MYVEHCVQMQVCVPSEIKLSQIFFLLLFTYLLQDILAPILNLAANKQNAPVFLIRNILDLVKYQLHAATWTSFFVFMRWIAWDKSCVNIRVWKEKKARPTSTFLSRPVVVGGGVDEFDHMVAKYLQLDFEVRYCPSLYHLCFLNI